MSERRGAVLVTGAAKGIGRACVERLAKRFRVYAGVRRLEDGEALRAELGPEVVPVQLEVTDAAAIRTAADFIRSDLGAGHLIGIVNNAGMAVAGPLEFLPMDELRRQFEVNVIGQVAVTQAMLPLLRESRGRIVNMGSIAGKSAMPMTGPYSASKFALEAITDSLRVELLAFGVDVIIIEPGVIATPIWQTSIEAADTIMKRLPPKAFEYYGPIMDRVRQRALNGDIGGLPADAVAQVVEHALTSAKPKTRYMVGRDAKIRALLGHLPDRWRDRIIARQLAKI
jgi:NAD(P)-dependent dehydrogenase (short-subunit alcohol dehydrogenase family)